MQTDIGAIEWTVKECSVIKQAWERVDLQISGEQGRADEAQEVTAEAVPALEFTGRQKNLQASRSARAPGL
jgi:hypothetical protein